MLQLVRKTPSVGGYYRTGRYSLVIAPRYDNDYANGVIDMTRQDREYVFRPNPSDIDDATQFPNIIRPDQDGGFYIDVNEIGMKTIAIRGITGQFPTQTVFDQVMGAKGAAISSTTRFIRDLSESRQWGEGREATDGYGIFIELVNFFVRWSELIRDNPRDWALLFVNTKDAEIYEVLPMRLQKTRTAARPLTYGYALELQIVDEPNNETTRRRLAQNWVERMNDIRGRIKRWQNAINRTFLLASQILQSVSLGAVGSVYGPITDTLTSMTSGLQGLMFSADAISRYSIDSHERMKEVAESLFAGDQYTHGYFGERKLLPELPPLRSVPGMVPPTRENIDAIYGSNGEHIADGAITRLQSSLYGPGEKTNLSMDDPFLDVYADALDMMFQGYLAADNSPLPSDSVYGGAGFESRDIHRAVRAGAAGLIEGRSQEFASAKLAGDTFMVEDSVRSTSTRHGKLGVDFSTETFSLSYLAAVVVPQFVRSHNEERSPQLSRFRKEFLGMRDPSTFSPFYKTVEVQLTDTVYTLAAKYLGTWRRWTEIALVNDLRYPYISQNGGAYQKAPGEKIYIPHADSKVPVTVLESFIDIVDVHDKLTTLDVFLGFDVELSQLTGDMTFVGNDVAHVAGEKAFSQEMAMVLEGSGGVTPDRYYGPQIKIGTKSRGRDTLEFWKSIIKTWLQADYRVASVDLLTITQDRSVVQWSAKLRFENFDKAVTVAGALRN